MTEMIALNANLSFQLQANVIASIPTTPVYNVQLSQEEVVIASGTRAVNKVIHVLNKSNKTIDFSADPINFNGLTVPRNSCANTQLLSKRSCFFELAFSAVDINTTKSTFVEVLDKNLIVKLGPQVPGSNLLEGSLLDGFIAGIRYTTPSYSGITDVNGNFNCNANETVSFYLGTMLIGSLPCGSVISPIELATNGTQNYQTDISSLSTTEQIEVTNLARLLQSLDNDGNPDNGIVIDSAVATKTVELITASGDTIDSLVNGASFSTDLTAIIQQVNTSLSVTLSSVSVDDALTHFDDTRFQTVSCIPADVTNSITVSGVKPSCAATSCQANFNLVAGSCQPTVSGLTVTPSVNLGSFTGLGLEATATITNTTNAGLEVRITPGTFTTEGFSYETTRCPTPPTTLRKNSSCQITIFYLSAASFATDTVRTEKLTVNGVKTIDISVTHKGAPPKTESATFSWITNPLNFGTVSAVTSLTTSVKNTSGATLSGLVFNALPTGLSVLSTNCKDGELRDKASCNVQIQIDPSKMFNGPFSYEYTYSNYSKIAKLKINATIEGGKPVPVACTSADAQTNGWTITNYSTISGMKSGTDVSKCVVASCAATYSIDIYGKTCVPSTKECSTPDGTGTQTWTGTVYGACVVPSQTCEANYTMINGSCQPTPCVISDVGFSTAVVGTKVSGCQATACQSNYSLNAGQCQPATAVACDMTNAASYGVITGNVSSVSGNVPSCIVAQCASGFQPSADQKSCVASSPAPIACDMTNAEANGVNVLDVATVSGNVPSCMVASCLNSKQPSSDGKSCVTPTVACDMTNAAANGINITDVSAVSGNVPSCVVSSCLNGKQPSADQKSCITPVVACNLSNAAANGVSIANVLSVSGNVPSCSVATCAATFEPSPDQKSCIPAACSMNNAAENGINISNVVSVNGLVPNCLVASCSSSFQPSPDQKSCVPAPETCSLSNAAENGIDIANVTTVTGTVPSCTVSSCSAGNQPSVDGKSCVSSVVACNMTNAAGNGVNMTNVTAVSGNTPNCNVSSCSSGSEPSVDGKSCESPTVKLFGTLDKFCAVGIDNTAKCSGGYFYSAFGNSSIIQYAARDTVRIEDVKSIDIGASDLCWITTSKNLKCHSQYGYKAGPAYAASGYVRDFGLNNVKKIIGLATVMCMVKDDNSVHCMGSDSKFTAPNVISNTNFIEAPQFAGATNIVGLNNGHSLCGHYPNGEVKCVNLFNGTNNSNNFRTVTELGYPSKIQSGSMGICAFYPGLNMKCKASPISFPEPYSGTGELLETATAVDYSGSCLKFADGKIKCAATPYSGEFLMNNTKYYDKGSLIEVPGLNSSLSFIGTRSQVCGVNVQGETYCVGDDKLLAISPDSFESHEELRLSSIPWNGSADSEMFSLGNGNMMCLKNLSTSQYQCSGNNGAQQHMISSANNQFFSNFVVADTLNSLGAGTFVENNTSYGFVSSSGQASIIGDGGYQYGAIYGDDNQIVRNINFANPVKLMALNQSGMCLVDTTDNVYCTGETDTWNTGLPMDTGTITTPTYVATIAGAKKIVSNNSGFCILTNAGSVHCVGNNVYEKSLPTPGDVVTDTFTQVSTPVPLDDIKLGARFICGIKNSTNELYCGGSNYYSGWGDVHYAGFELVDTKGLGVKTVSLTDWGLCFNATNGNAYCKDIGIWYQGGDYTYDPYYKVTGVEGTVSKLWIATSNSSPILCVQNNELEISCAGNRSYLNFGTGSNIILTPSKIWDQF